LYAFSLLPERSQISGVSIPPLGKYIMRGTILTRKNRFRLSRSTIFDIIRHRRRFLSEAQAAQLRYVPEKHCYTRRRLTGIAHCTHFHYYRNAAKRYNSQPPLNAIYHHISANARGTGVLYARLTVFDAKRQSKRIFSAVKRRPHRKPTCIVSIVICPRSSQVLRFVGIFIIAGTQPRYIES